MTVPGNFLILNQNQKHFEHSLVSTVSDGIDFCSKNAENLSGHALNCFPSLPNGSFGYQMLVLRLFVVKNMVHVHMLFSIWSAIAHTQCPLSEYAENMPTYVLKRFRYQTLEYVVYHPVKI